MQIDTTRQISETPIFSLTGVGSLVGKGLRCMFCTILDNIYNVFQTGVDLAPRTLTG